MIKIRTYKCDLILLAAPRLRSCDAPVQSISNTRGNTPGTLVQESVGVATSQCKDLNFPKPTKIIKVIGNFILVNIRCLQCMLSCKSVL